MGRRHHAGCDNGFASKTVYCARATWWLEQWLQSDLCFEEISLLLSYFSPLFTVGSQKNIGTHLVSWRYFRGNEWHIRKICFTACKGNNFPTASYAVTISRDVKCRESKKRMTPYLVSVFNLAERCWKNGKIFFCNYSRAANHVSIFFSNFYTTGNSLLLSRALFIRQTIRGHRFFLPSHLLLPKILCKRTKIGVLVLFRFIIHEVFEKKGQKILVTNCKGQNGTRLDDYIHFIYFISSEVRVKVSARVRER